MHYTQIKKSDLNFEPLAEFIVEDGGWLDITLISDSPLLEHDAMYMLQSIEKSKHRQLERKAREDRRRALSAQTGTTPAALAAKEAQLAALLPDDAQAPAETDAEPVAEPVVEAMAETVAEPGTEPAAEAVAEPAAETEKPAKKAPKKKASKAEEKNTDVFDFEEEDDDLF